MNQDEWEAEQEYRATKLTCAVFIFVLALLGLAELVGVDMNGGKSKRLRRQAEAETVGMKPVAYKIETVKRPVMTMDGKTITSVTHVATLKPSCTRAVYQQKKREAA